MAADAQKSSRRRKTVRRTPPFSELPPAAQQAYHQEMLDQAALFRQIAAAANGVAGPVGRNIIPEWSVEEEETTASAETAATPPSAGLGKGEIERLLDENKKGLKKTVAGGIGAVLLSSLLGVSAMQYLGRESNDGGNDAVAPPAASEQGDQNVVDTEQELLQVLGSEGYAIPETDLTTLADRVYERNPALLDKHLKELQEYFDQEE